MTDVKVLIGEFGATHGKQSDPSSLPVRQSWLSDTLLAIPHTLLPSWRCVVFLAVNATLAA